MSDDFLSNRVLLNTSNLSVGYRQKKGKTVNLQSSLNLDLFEGELVCLIGPNGCGKSTLIRTLSGIQPSLAGKVLVDGKDITDLPISQRSELIGVVLTDKDAVENITVREIVSLGRYKSSNWLGQVNTDDEIKINDAIDLVSLGKFDDRTYGSLSDGEKQRTFIAKVLASDSMIMLLDEPTAHLDIPNKVSIMKLLRDLTRKSGHAIIVSTHELDLALQLADQIWLMVPGDNFYTGLPEEVLQIGLLDKVFGNESLSFNPGSGSFCVHTQNQLTIFMEGDDNMAQMTLHAAERLGFQRTSKDNAEVIVKTEEAIWMINFKNEIYKTDTFNNLCRLLEKISKIVKR